MKQAYYCSQCGHANNTGAQFCGNCGHVLPALSSLPTIPIATPTAGPRVPFWLVGTASLLIVIAGILFLTEGCIAGIDLFHRCLPQTAAISPTSTPPPPPPTPVVPSQTPTPSPTSSATPPSTILPTSTATMMSTVTPRPSPTSSPAPSAVPVQANRFIPIPLDAVSNGTLDFAAPAVGLHEFDNILFRIGSGVFKSQASTPPFDRYPTQASLSVSIFRAQKIHLLINAGNGYNHFLNQTVGSITVTCEDQPYLVRELRLGRDLREWHVAANVVSHAAAAIPVWEGATTVGVSGFLDLLSLELPPQCHAGMLTNITISDDSVPSLNTLDPALNIAAITIEANGMATQP